MENILFKISFPAEFHAQTAVEIAVRLHPEVKDRLHEIKEILIETQESCDRIINKTGELNNPADRDHCLQYMVAVALIKGALTADDYEQHAAEDKNIDHLRGLMKVVENRQFTADYLDPGKRAIGNAISVTFSDGSTLERISVDYPVGHRRRRQEGIPLLVKKFEDALQGRLSADKCEQIITACNNQHEFENMSVNTMMALLAV